MRRSPTDYLRVLGLTTVTVCAPFECDDLPCFVSGVYQSPVGLHFTFLRGFDQSGGYHCAFHTIITDSYLGEEIQADNVTIKSTGESLEHCMDQCSVFRPLCYGTVFDSRAKLCTFKSPDFVYHGDGLNKTDSISLAVAHKDDLTPRAKQCDLADPSTHTTSTGQEITVYCNSDVSLPDGDFTSVPFPGHPVHANDIEGCMDACSTARPLCAAAVYNPDMSLGYANCYLKSLNPDHMSFPDDYQLPGEYVVPQLTNQENTTIVHAIVASQPIHMDNTCHVGTIRQPGSEAEFDVKCDHDVPGNTLECNHADSLSACMDRCVSYGTNKCKGVVYDSNLAHGFQNCCLKDNNARSEAEHITADAPGKMLALFQERQSLWSEDWTLGCFYAIILAVLFVVWCLGRFCPQHDDEKSETIEGASEEAPPSYYRMFELEHMDDGHAMDAPPPYRSV